MEEHHNIMCLSDVRTFQESEVFLREIKPRYVFLLGDILYDGPGQIYQLSDNKIIADNTHYDEFIEKIHLKHFTTFLKACIRMAVEKVFIVSGNHDKDTNYAQIISSAKLSKTKIVFLTEPLKVEICGIDVFIIPYPFLGKRKLRPFISTLCQSSIVMTHGELRHLRYLVEENKFNDNRNRLIISVHLGYGYFSPERIAEALVTINSKLGKEVFSKEGINLYPHFHFNKNVHILRIDSFPFSFCVLKISSNTIEGKLLRGITDLLSKFLSDNSFLGNIDRSTRYTDNTYLLEEFDIKL